MTRDDEIYKRLQEIDASKSKSLSECKGYMNGYIDGSKWADSTMIDKACEWLEQNAYLYCDDIDTLHESALIGDFRHAMKGY